MQTESTAYLRLLHLADSVLPIGGVAHSFGVETLTQENQLTVTQLGVYFADYLCEGGVLEAAYCRRGYDIGTALASALSPVDAQDNPSPPMPLPPQIVSAWLDCNRRLSARMPARESRAASANLGQRLLRLVLHVEPDDPVTAHLPPLLLAAKQQQVDTHYCAAFGLAGGILALGEEETVLAYLQQSVSGLISACQRLLPLGQSHAARLRWQLHAAMHEAADCSHTANQAEDVPTFCPQLEIGSMRHPALPVRLFIS